MRVRVPALPQNKIIMKTLKEITLTLAVVSTFAVLVMLITGLFVFDTLLPNIMFPYFVGTTILQCVSVGLYVIIGVIQMLYEENR